MTEDLMQFQEITEALAALNDPLPIKKVNPNVWEIYGDGCIWQAIAGAVDVASVNDHYRVLTLSFKTTEQSGFGVTGGTTRKNTIRLFGSLIKILQQFKKVDIIVFKPQDDPGSQNYEKKVEQKTTIYNAIGQYCVTQGLAFHSKKLDLGPLGNVVVVFPMQSRALSLSEDDTKMLIADAWFEKHDPDAEHLDADPTSDQTPNVGHTEKSIK